MSKRACEIIHSDEHFDYVILNINKKNCRNILMLFYYFHIMKSL